MLDGDEGGYFTGNVDGATPGSRYRYQLDSVRTFPDPASRFQPEGPDGPSLVVDPRAFAWADADWRGLTKEGQVLYEMHVGTFTPEGTWAAAESQLPTLADLGITAIELMPVADFPGRYGWGYDGVNLYAPTRLYGTPDDFRRFVDRAHRVGLGVILDVVYNHMGPEGCYLGEFSEEYFSDRTTTEWGPAGNIDGPGSAAVREFVLTNAAYWIDEFHLDGLRIDATQAIFDSSPEHILAAIGRTAREAAPGRSVLLIVENEPQQARNVLSPEQGGFGLDMTWNDDFHHTAIVALTGHNEGYYSGYRGSPQEFISALKRGFLYQGQRFSWQHKRRGAPVFGLSPSTFVLYLQNHDQIANSIRSRRCHQLTSPGRYRAMTTLFLLAKGTLLLFQGQEFAASSPFHYFNDLGEPIRGAVRQGYAKFLEQFRTLAHPESQAVVADPTDSASFERSKLDLTERDHHAEAYALHLDLLRLRREDPVFADQRGGRLDGAVLGEEAFVLRYFGEAGDDRLLVVNFGLDLRLEAVPEPLLAPPMGRRWEVLWSSEHPKYGGGGTPVLETQEHWLVPGQAAVALIPQALEDQASEEPDA
jgi:maltooligosyltrehalose trehalohydrolase